MKRGKAPSKQRSNSGMEEDLVEEASIGRDATYFGYYGQLANQQNMLSDVVRTGTYQWAISHNPLDFQNKTVLDVGAGSGILSFFAAQAGARKVYAVEASGVAECAKVLAVSNGLGDQIEVIKARLEDVQLQEKVDVIISEPMGVLLVHERMIETFIKARNLWLKENGKMFPSSSKIFLAPFTDSFLYSETMSKVRFWHQEDFYGFNLSALSNHALNHHFAQPVVGCFDPRSLLSNPVEKKIDFMTVKLEQLREFSIETNFVSRYTGIVHGIAGWFEVNFEGSEVNASLTTSPYAPKTHWYQVRFLFKIPIAINVGQKLSGVMHLKANEQRSYNIRITLALEGTSIFVNQEFSLHEQQYWYPNNLDQAGTMYPETFNLYQGND